MKNILETIIGILIVISIAILFMWVNIEMFGMFAWIAIPIEIASVAYVVYNFENIMK